MEGIDHTNREAKHKEYTDLLKSKLHCPEASDHTKMPVIAPWLFYGFISSLFGLIAGVMTTYYGQGAAGSGVAELIGYMNGVNYGDFISVPTLITKIIGVTFAVCGKLCVGKEGPLAHIGGILGVLTAYIPGLGLEFLRNDEKRRQLVAAGSSAGVSVAFGAPVGGALFAYEMSKPNTFWRFSMIWKVFASCALANFWLALLNSVHSGDYSKFSNSSLKMGGIDKVLDVNTPLLLVPAICLGIIGGMIGPFFININTRMATLRGKILTKKWMKPIETMFFCFMTASSFFWIPYLVGFLYQQYSCEDMIDPTRL